MKYVSNRGVSTVEMMGRGDGFYLDGKFIFEYAYNSSIELPNDISLEDALRLIGKGNINLVIKIMCETTQEYIIIIRNTGLAGLDYGL